MTRVDSSSSAADMQQQIDEFEEQQQEQIQFEDTQAQNDLAVRRADETRTNEVNDQTSAQAISGANASAQQSRGADWAQFSDRSNTTVPPSVSDIQDESRRIEQSNNAQQANQDDANRREMQQRMTVQEITNELTKQSGIIRG